MPVYSRVLAAVLVLVAIFFYLLYDTGQETATLHKFNQELFDRKLYRPLLEMAFVAASMGTNLLPSRQRPSEDCVRTAAVAMRLYVQPSTSNKIVSTMKYAFSAAKGQADEDTSLQESVERVCKILNGDVEQQQDFVLANFDRLKRTVKLPKASRNSLVDVANDRLTVESLQSAIGALYDRQLLRYLVVSSFRTSFGKNGDMANVAKNMSVAETIFYLAEQPKFRSSVDSEFGRVLEYYIEYFVLRYTSYPKAHRATNSNTIFMRKVDQHFLKNSALAELANEYAKIKNAPADKFLSEVANSEMIEEMKNFLLQP